MYQSIASELKEDAFKKLLVAFDINVANIDEVVDNTFDDIWDLRSNYLVKWGCAWNHVNAVNKECIILQKNDKVALVQFEDRGLNHDVGSRIYRLEDLQAIPKNEMCESKESEMKKEINNTLMLEEGKTYELQDGTTATMLKMVSADKNPRYDCMLDTDGIHRYSRIDNMGDDNGRVTGTHHDYSFAKNVRIENEQFVEVQ